MDNVQIIKIANDEQNKIVQSKVMPVWNSKVFITSADTPVWDDEKIRTNDFNLKLKRMLHGGQNIKRSKSVIAEKRDKVEVKSFLAQ